MDGDTTAAPCTLNLQTAVGSKVMDPRLCLTPAARTANGHQLPLNIHSTYCDVYISDYSDYNSEIRLYSVSGEDHALTALLLAYAIRCDIR